ncbi:MAG TPA: PaaI family thioesterase [Caulobacteraceae bacterium]|nr:PaaI family thioesterase [Caulobacteraceae bacterium]
MADEPVPPPPEGFVPSARGPFTTHNGPFFHKLGEDGAFEHAFYVLKRHCNGMGIAHGGMLTTFLDGLLARAVFTRTGSVPVTVHLSVDFLSMARAGEWVFGDARVTRQARDLVFVEGRVRVGERDVIRGSGVFKPMRRRID